MKLNKRFLRRFGLVFVTLGLGVYGLHYIQVSRATNSLLQRARASVEAKDPNEGLRWYRQYLKLADHDFQARAEYGQVWQSLGNWREAFFAFEESLREEPDQPEIREKLVEVALNIDRYTDAIDHLAVLEQNGGPNRNPKWAWFTGQCNESMGEFKLALQSYEYASSEVPANVDYASSLGELLTRRFSRPTDARAVFDRMVQENPSAGAALARGRWLLRQASRLTLPENQLKRQLLEQAAADAHSARAYEPDDSAPVLFLIEVALAQGDVQNAEEAIAEALGKFASVPEIHGSAAKIQLAKGDADAAVACLKTGIENVPGNLDLLWNMAQLQIDLQRLDQATQIRKQLVSLQYPQVGLIYIDARVAIAKGEWLAATKLLENSRAFFDREKDLLDQVDYLLSVCYQKLGDVDQQLLALRRAIGSAPNWQKARQALADALTRAGRFQEAIQEHEQVIKRPNPPIDSVVNYARLLFVQQLGRDSTDRDWSRIESILKLLEDNGGASNSIAVVRAELAAATGDRDKAQDLLNSAIENSPESADLRQALIAFLIRSRDWPEVESTLTAFQTDFGDSPTLRLEKANLLIKRDGNKADEKALEALAKPDTKWSPEQQTHLAAGFAKIFLSLENFSEAEKQAQIVTSTQAGQNSLAFHLILFDLGLRSSNLEAMRGSLEQVGRIEGRGPLWRVGEAVRLIVESGEPTDAAESEKQSDALLSQALEQLKEAAVIRPAWSRIPRLRGEILERQGQKDLAIENYLEAISLGEKNPRLISKTVSLLFQSGRFLEADAVVRKLQEQRSTFSTALSRVAAQVSLQLENFDRALDLAEEWDELSGRQDDKIWLAQIYGITDNLELARSKFRAAIAMDEKAAAPWVAFVQMLAREELIDEALTVVQEADSAISDADRNDAIAQCYESLKEYKSADERYRKAVKERPNSIAILRRYAEFCLRMDKPDKVRSILEQIVQDKDESEAGSKAWARRRLALILGGLENQQSFIRAQQLIAINLEKHGNTLEDQRAKAIILSKRLNSDSVKEAISILESVLIQQARFSLADNALLANLYRRDNNWGKYARTMRIVLGNGGADQSQYVREYASALTSKGELYEAQLWLNRLKQLAPREALTFSVEAELLFKASDFGELNDLIQSKFDQSKEELLAAAQAAEASATGLAAQPELQAKFFVLADKAYTILGSAYPEMAWLRTASLARRGDIKLALDLLRQAREQVTIFAEVGQAALQGGKVSDQKLAELVRFGKQLDSASHPNIGLLMALADIESWRGNVENARLHYMRVLELSPNHVPALNNLAMMLALKNSRLAEANNAINLAVSSRGPFDYLLDTRGMVLLAMGEAAMAEADFRAALASLPRADRHFHLAEALTALDRIPEAVQQFKLALSLGLNKSALHPLERSSFDELSTSYN